MPKGNPLIKLWGTYVGRHTGYGQLQLPPLTRDEHIRYARHLSLPDVGVDGQRRLKAGRVALVGTGGLGSPAALYLAGPNG